MPTAYTSLLGLALPVQGELQGTWGDTVNTSITSLLDTAVAGTTTLSTDADVTLTTTTGAANQARQAILLCSGARTAQRTITAPAQSKIYTVINNTSGGFAVKVVGVGPTTGVTITAGESAQIAWNGSDFIKISSNSVFGAITVSNITDTALVAGRIPYASAGGLLVDSANMTFNGTVLTVNTLSLTNALSTANGGTGVTSFTANRVFYALSTSALGQSANLTFDGTTLTAANFTDSSLTSGRVTYAGTGGNLTDSANLTFDGTNLTLGGGTANGVTYLNGSKVLTTGSALTFDGTNIDLATVGAKVNFATTGSATRNYIGGSADGYSLEMVMQRGASQPLSYKQNFSVGHEWGIAGSGAMTLTSTGLGIGTSSPGAKLDVNLTSGGTAMSIATTTQTPSIGGGGQGIRFGWNGPTNGPTIRLLHGGSYNEAGFIFSTWTGASEVEKMRLTSSGNLGLNTTSPAALVHANLSSSGAGLIVGYATQTASQVNLGMGVLSPNRPFVGTNSSSNELEIGTMANVAMRFVTNGAIRGYISTLGSLGMGVEPGANHGNYGLFASGQAANYTALSMGASGNGYGAVGYGIGFTGTAGEYKALQTDNLAWVRFENGQIEFWNQMSATGGTTYTGTRNALFATNGDLLIGTNSSSGKLTVVTGNNNQAGYFQSGSGTTQQAIASFANSTNSGYLSIAGVGTSSVVATWNNGAIVQEAVPASSGHYFISAFTNDIVFQTAGRTNRGRITSGGYFVFGADTSAGFGSVNRIAAIGSQGNFILSIDGGTEYSMFAQAVNGANYSATDCAQRIGRNTSTLRSINAGGTINASGADYAEYMTKAGDFTIAKGDVCGVNADGKLTNVFADAISFVVKSTDPSYVGGDTWGSQETIGRKAPRPPAEGATEQEKQKYASDKAEYDALVEAARQNVDRVAFAGQVPVNVMGATPGQYIIPVNDNGAIKGVAVSNPTFEQYQVAVGKVIAVESDGRAKIIVKVA